MKKRYLNGALAGIWALLVYILMADIFRLRFLREHQFPSTRSSEAFADTVLFNAELALIALEAERQKNMSFERLVDGYFSAHLDVLYMSVALLFIGFFLLIYRLKLNKTNG